MILFVLQPSAVSSPRGGHFKGVSNPGFHLGRLCCSRRGHCQVLTVVKFRLVNSAPRFPPGSSIPLHKGPSPAPRLLNQRQKTRKRTSRWLSGLRGLLGVVLLCWAPPGPPPDQRRKAAPRGHWCLFSSARLFVCSPSFSHASGRRALTS